MENVGKVEKSKVISARLTGKNLALFNKMGLSPTQLINYAVKEYSHTFFSRERLDVLTKIQMTLADMERCEWELKNKRMILAGLREELEAIETKEYNAKKGELYPLLKERYHEDILKGTVDCVQDFIIEEKSFIDNQAYLLEINQGYLDLIVGEFYEEESHSVGIDNGIMDDNLVQSNCSK